MFDIIQLTEELFHATVSEYKEILLEFTCIYNLEKQNLPAQKELATFLTRKPVRDKLTITIASDIETVYVGDGIVWEDKYDNFFRDIYEEDKLIAIVKVTKTVDEGKLSIYNLKKFSDFLCSLNTMQVFDNFTRLFRDCGNRIVFQLLDTNGSLRTNSIIISDNEIQWSDNQSREQQLKNCQDAGVFLVREIIRLVPQDFEVKSIEGNGFDEIVNLFGKLKTILSYLYLANTSNVVNNKAVLQFDPTYQAYEYELECIARNDTVPKIYAWVFKEGASVDKASIARKIINTYCRNRESILAIDEKILNSIKSDYVIYQKNHVDQYIDMKNRISDYIVESAGKIQGLSHDIADAFRNNFVAIIVFLMTVLLTDSIDFTQMFGREISPRVTAVCALFTAATYLYLKVTLAMCDLKWKWIDQSYKDLKKNYEGVFDEQDIDEAFCKDAPLNNAKKQYEEIKDKIQKYWNALIIAMAIFTVILFCLGCIAGKQQRKIDEDVLSVGETTSYDVSVSGDSFVW